MNVAVCGLRHGHLGSIVKHVASHPGMKIVAVAEERPDLCAGVIEAAGVKVTHRNLDDLLSNVEFDLLVAGDVYARRGAQVVRALQAGKHIMADKPLCTRVADIEAIRELSRSKKRSVMVALTLRYGPALRAARQALLSGAIGRVTTAIIQGQHPLNYGRGRPEWYFEPGQHGGTIADLMIHGYDAVAWMTGRAVAETLAARAWHVEPAEAPCFQDAAQVMLRLDNGAGVMIEASYKAPRGHRTPWFFQFWGTEGDMSVRSGEEPVLRRHDEPERKLALDPAPKTNYVDDLSAEILGSGVEVTLTTEDCLRAAEQSVRAQALADGAGR